VTKILGHGKNRMWVGFVVLDAEELSGSRWIRGAALNLCSRTTTATSRNENSDQKYDDPRHVLHTLAESFVRRQWAPCLPN